MCTTQPQQDLIEKARQKQLQEACWRKVHRMVWQLVHKHHKVHGGDLDELMGEAQLYFANAVVTWDPTKGALTTWVHWQVRGLLLNHQRAERRRLGKCSYNSEALNWEATKESCFDVRSFLREISNDAAIVATLALESPKEVLALLTEGRLDKDTVRTCRGWLVGFLIGLGWGTGRVLAAFREVRDTLRD